MPRFHGRRSSEVEAFVAAAVRVPFDDLMEIHRRNLSAEAIRHRVAVELVIRADDRTWHDSLVLREYIKCVATELGTPCGSWRFGVLSVNWLAAAIFPAAQALLVADLLEEAACDRKREAFRSLTAPFAGLLPERRGAPRARVARDHAAAGAA